MLAVIGAVFVILLIVLVSANSSSAAPGKYDQVYQSTLPNGSPIMGDPRVAFAVIEFADFGCAPCLHYEATMATLIDKYVRPGQIRLAFSPLVLHDNAQIAAQGALCALPQNKFWLMRDALYDLQATHGPASLTIPAMRSAAEGVGIDGKAWFDCVAAPELTQRTLSAARKQFDALHLTGTPALLWSTDGTRWQFFLGDNGQPYGQGEVPLAVIARTIDAYYLSRQK